MTQDQVIELTKAIGICELTSKPKNDIHYSLTIHEMQKFAKLVAQHERDVISDEWWSCYQSDLENGVKSLNEYEAKKFAITYPELAKFGSWLEARGQA
jgi:hypothetical protein